MSAGPAALLADLDEANHLIVDLVNQHCHIRPDGLIESGAISTNADAIRYLAEHGWVEIVSEHGRFVVARWTQEGGR